MICKNCGANIPAGISECEFCGTIVDVSVTGVRTTSTTRSFVALLSSEEQQVLSSLIAKGSHAEAQRFIMNVFGFNGQQAFEIINQVVKYKDAVIPNLDILIKNLTPKSKGVLFFDNSSEKAQQAQMGAKNKYLCKLGYASDEQILLLYDNAILKSGESGFVITNKQFYSSGSMLIDKAFVFPLRDIKTTRIDGSTLIINDRKVDIVLTDANDYLKICAIVSRIIRTNR